MKWRKMNIQHKSSTPMAWKLILKPVFKAYILNNRVNKLLDYSETVNDQRISTQMYSKDNNYLSRF